MSSDGTDDTDFPRGGSPEHEDSDDDDDDDDDYPAARQGPYSSRVEQILSENKDLLIHITDAGKNNEGGGGGYIVYTIRTAVGIPRPL